MTKKRDRNRIFKDNLDEIAENIRAMVSPTPEARQALNELGVEIIEKPIEKEPQEEDGD